MKRFLAFLLTAAAALGADFRVKDKGSITAMASDDGFYTDGTTNGVRFFSPNANVRSVLGAADYSAIRTLLSLVPGTNVQAFDADLSTYAGITPAANVQSVLAAADYSAIRTLLGLVIGTNVQAFDADLSDLADGTLSASTLESTVTRDIEWDSIAEIETATGAVNILLATEIDTSSELGTILTDETGTGLFVRGTDPILLRPNAAMGALSVDVTKMVNTYTTSAGTHTFTFSATPAAGTTFGVLVTGHASASTITVPSSRSISRGGATITTFVMPVNGKAEITWRYDGTDYFIAGEPWTINDLAAEGSPVAANDYALVYSATAGAEVKVLLEDFPAAVGAAWNDIGDTTADGTIALGAHETDFTSTIDAAGEAIWTITNTDADAANDNSLLDLQHNDTDDANVFYMRLRGDADATPTDDYLFSQTTMTVRPAAVFQGAVSITGPLTVPNLATDSTLSAAGHLALNTADEQMSFHSAADGEISGEVSISAIRTFSITFDPKAVCDGAVDRLFLFKVGDDAPEGIIIDEWSISFEADPTTEVDLDFKSADAPIGVANAAVLDALDTTTGAATEDTDANINAGAVVANGKWLYLEFATAYTEANHQIVFQIWYHNEED